MPKILIIFLTVILCLLYIFNVLEPLDEALLDLQFNLRPDKEYRSEIVVAALDEQALTNIGKWPWPRHILADLIDNLAAMSPAVIGLDILLNDPDDMVDTRLQESIKAAGNVILSSFVQSLQLGEHQEQYGFIGHNWSKPLSYLESVALGTGHISILASNNRLVHTVPSKIIEVLPNGESQAIPAFALALAEHGSNGYLSGDELPLLLYLNYPGAILPHTISALDILQNQIDPELIKDKIIIVGLTARGILDYHLTPFHADVGIPGAYIHATALNSLLTDSYLYRVGKGLVIGLILGVSLLIICKFKGRLSIGKAVGGIVILGAISFLLFCYHNIWLDIAPVIIHVIFISAINAGCSYREILQEKKYLQTVFQRYVSSDVLKQLTSKKIEPQLGGKRENISVIFVDIRDFTSFAEVNSPEDVVKTLNQYLAVISEPVLALEGMVDKFLGDGMMGIFGTPYPIKESAAAALQAAITIQGKIEELNKFRTENHKPVLQCGIGIATGPAVIGNIGSAQRMDYTAIGDIVNLAHRIQAQATAGQILIDEATYAQIPDLAYYWRQDYMIKGRVSQVKLYAVDYHSQCNGI